MSTPDPAPATTDTKTTTSLPASLSLDSLKSMMPGSTPAAPPPNTKEGPNILPTNPPTDTTPPEGDNSAPPPVKGDIPPPKKELTLQEILMGVLFLVLCVVGIYFGLTLGIEEGHGYLLFIQSFGPWIRSWFTSRHALPSVYDIKK